MKKRITLVAVLAVVLACAMLFAACTPASNPETAKEKLDKKGYSVSLDTNLAPAGLALVGITGVKTVLTASYSDDDTTEFLTVWYFSSASDVKEVWEKAKSYASDQEKDKEKDKKDKEESNWTVGKSGKMIWFGTKNAVKAAA